MTVGDILDRGLKLLLARLPVFYAINLIVLTSFWSIAAPLVVEAGAGPGSSGRTLDLLFAVLLALISSRSVLRLSSTSSWKNTRDGGGRSGRPFRSR